MFLCIEFYEICWGVDLKKRHFLITIFMNAFNTFADFYHFGLFQLPGKI